jgi:hypothetical protein
MYHTDANSLVGSPTGTCFPFPSGEKKNEGRSGGTREGDRDEMEKMMGGGRLGRGNKSRGRMGRGRGRGRIPEEGWEEGEGEVKRREREKSRGRMGGGRVRSQEEMGGGRGRRKGRNLFLSIGSGKTIVAELAMLKIFRDTNLKIVYIGPLK